MRSPAALATIAALALAAAPAAADEPALAAAPAPAMTPAPYLVPPGMVPMPYGGWTRPFAFVEGRTSEAMRITGFVFFGAGSVVTTGGAVVIIASELQACQDVVDPVANHGKARRRGAHEAVGIATEPLTACDGGPAAGAVTLAVGALLGVVGVPLFVVGSKAVLVPAPAVHLGAGTADLRWSF